MLDLLAALCAVLALLVLAAGSAIIGIAFVGGRSHPSYPYDLGIGAGYAIALAWPLTALVSGLLGAAALATTQGMPAALVLLLISVGIAVFVQRSLYRIAAMSDGAFPKRGLPAVLVIVLFLSLNLGAIVLAWRHLL